MGIFGKFGAKLAGSSNKLSGRKDALEAMCAITARIASVDGTISDSEIDKAEKSINSMAMITDNFDKRDIDACLNKMFERAKGGRMGRRELMREILEIKDDKEIAEAVITVGLDVADDNGIGADEMADLEYMSKEIGVDLKRLLAAG